MNNVAKKAVLKALMKRLESSSQEFEAFRDSMPENYWARYDLSAVRLGWEAAIAARTAAVVSVLTERRRQIEVEGWTIDHDDQHNAGEMAAAAASYAVNAADQLHPMSQGDGAGDMPVSWPWGVDWWKPMGPRRDLVRAAALILAEIEKLDRTNLQEGS